MQMVHVIAEHELVKTYCALNISVKMFASIGTIGPCALYLLSSLPYALTQPQTHIQTHGDSQNAS